VLATGGGTPCYGDSMMFLSSQKDVKTIYLKASLDILTARLEEEKEHRPLLAHLKTKEDFNDFIRKHLFERSFYYNQSNFIIDNNDTVAETLEKIILKLF
jgi:shikimate kinase